MNMLSPILWFSVAASAALLLLVSGCSKRSGLTAESDETGKGGEFYQPRKGEFWKYKVQREVPIEVKLSPADQARRPERTESGHLITFERVRTCNGTRELEGADTPLTTMEIAENGVPLGEEFYEINEEGVFSRGWLAAGSDDSRRGDFLNQGVALATAKMQPGQIWEGLGLDPNRRFVFRVIEFASVKVPAGTFDAARIQITSEQDGKSLKRTIWFAANVGIVKEESVYYGPQRTRVRERAELIHWVIPEDPASIDQALITTDGEPSSGNGSEFSPAEDEEPPDGNAAAEEDDAESEKENEEDEKSSPEEVEKEKDEEEEAADDSP